MLRSTLETRLADLRDGGLFRRLRVVEGAQGPVVGCDGREILLLSSNNYLGLNNHPALKKAAWEAIQEFGCGAGASRLISGTMELHRALESRLAAFKQTDSALVFPSGYHANVGTLPALMGAGDTILSDELNHASIIDGCRLSRADIKVFRHRDMDHLERLLAGCRESGRRLIVTDSVFSMDGDVAPLQEIAGLGSRYGAWVMVDEAHAAGVFGPGGAGLVEELGLTARIEVQMGTLSKALGGSGAYVAGSGELIEWLVNRARSFVYTTAVPPSTAATALAALEIVASEPERRARLWRNADLLREGLKTLGYTLASGESPVVPVMVGDAQKTVDLSEALFRRGVLAYGVRPPTVPEGTSRLRLTAMATHSRSQLAGALQAFREAGKEIGILP